MGSYNRRTKDEYIEDLKEDLKAKKKEIKALRRIWERLNQKWIAAVDEYNECRYDCKLMRLMTAF